MLMAAFPSVPEDFSAFSMFWLHEIRFRLGIGRRPALPEFQNPLVKDHISCRDGPLEPKPGEAAAAAQGHIDLAVGKSSIAQLEKDAVEGLPLALMDGD